MVVIAVSYLRIKIIKSATFPSKDFIFFFYLFHNLLKSKARHQTKNYFRTEKLKLKQNFFFKDKLSLTDTTVKFLLKETVD